ncbi:hypothetical protein BK661_10145 [Pseudomonas frederiksbergensis]|uniref:DUF2971 domain-containing protein n=1 Tax=Pseudomonas frederiksbergensis TaxID=104087 RepID=A0A423JAH3_9PSED|nr:hypothetical protein BK661_10145 [Pseudomonas frederiksbergensis]
MKIPGRLYKYETLNARTLQNIKGQILYFGSPLGFNDPYDCALRPNIVTPNDDVVEAVRAAYLAQERLTTGHPHEFLTKTTQELREMLLRAADSETRKYTDAFLHSRGVTCFTEKNDDLLMWSHYGGTYKGVCLEFDTSTAPFEKISPVRYSQSLPDLHVSEILLGHNLEQVWQLFCTKSESWSYEREWRAFHEVAGTQYIYPSEALTGVYFGPDIDNESLEIVCLILAGQNETVRYYKGERSTTEFRVEFKEFTYTPYLQAKKQGDAP